MRGMLQSLAIQAYTAPIYPDPRFPPSLYYRFLGLLSNAMAPATCVELGVCGGGGSLYMAWANSGNVVVGVDVSNEYPDQITHVRSTCPNFQFWQRDSIDAVLTALKADIRVDLLFIDTVHTEERTVAEFDAWRPLLTPRAVVVLDDLHRIGMDRAWNRIPGERMIFDDLHLGGSPTDEGFGVIWNPGGWK